MPNRLRTWLAGLPTLVQRSRFEAEMAEELAFHLRERTDALVTEGLTEEEAARQARLEFGGVEVQKERCREAWGLRVADEIRGDFRYAVRSLRQTPAFTVIAVLTLAIGIGANALVFGVVDALLFRPPSGVAHPSRVARVYPRLRHPTGNAISVVSYQDYQALAQDPRLGARVAAYQVDNARLGESADAPSVHTVFVSRHYFDVLGIRPKHGRAFTTDEQENETAGHVALLSDAFWRQHFGGKPSAVGKTLTLNDVPVRIVGILPSDFTGIDLTAPAVWLPLPLAVNEHFFGKLLRQGNYRWFRLIARLPAEVQPAALATRIGAAIRDGERRMNDALPADARSPYTLGHVDFAPLQSHFDGREAPVSIWFLAVTAIVLLIACANVASLLLSRAVRRRHELGVRLALGASRWRVVRQLLVESFALGGAGALAALAAVESSAGLVRLLPLHGIDDLVDPRVLAFTAGVAILACLLFGTIPALWATRQGEQTLLTGTGPMSSPARSALRDGLLISQLTLSLTLLVAAGLFVRSLHNVELYAPGFDTSQILVARLELPAYGYTAAEARSFEQQLLARLRARPEVTDAALSSAVSFLQWSLVVIGVPPAPDHMGPPLPTPVTAAVVGEDFFRTVEARPLRGRFFSARDEETVSTVAVVNEAFADHFWPGEDPIGRCVQYPVASRSCTTVVGIVSNIRYTSPTEPDRPTLFVPMTSGLYASLFVRARGPLAPVVSFVRTTISSLDPRLQHV